jgi:molybdenum cofactor cytidylyltransferase
MPLPRRNSAIAAVILAAGASTRMGTPKQLLQFQGRSLLRTVTETAIAADCDPIYVVLGAYFNQIQSEVSALPVHIVENREWQMGMGASICSGIQALPTQTPDVEAAILLLCDQPFVSPQLIEQLKSLHYSSRQPIVASIYQNTIGVPALFHSTLFSELVSLPLSEGAKTLIQRHQNKVMTIDFALGAIDLDTPEDYQRYLKEKLEIQATVSLNDSQMIHREVEADA